ncbi:MAG: dynamin family protein [Desulforegulaceae bacterium]|nr:dynamin family protein [Desulforegulaceae bacterium]
MSLWDAVDGQKNSSSECFSVVDDLVNRIKKNKEDIDGVFNYFSTKIDITTYTGTNKYLQNPYKGMQLLSDIMASEENGSELLYLYNEFYELIYNDYMLFAEKDDFPEEAKIFNKIQKLISFVEDIVKFPEINKKKIIALGGGFSAGKSSFLNSFLGFKSDLLPVDTRPTTSIPTYVVSSKAKNNTTLINCYNYVGKKTKIDQEALTAISHEFYDIFSFTLTKIIKKICIESSEITFENLAFLDTPGYTKSQKQLEGDNTDEEIAKKHLKAADHMIWFIDIEQGIIPATDIQFIQSLEFDEPILFILNKADKKPIEEVKKIKIAVEDTLKSQNISFVDIVAYSSHDNLEVASDNRIAAYLDKLNSSNIKKINITNELKEIFDKYELHHSLKIEKYKSILGTLNKVKTLAYKTIRLIPEFDDVLAQSKKDFSDRNDIKDELIKLKEKILNKTKNIEDQLVK